MSYRAPARPRQLLRCGHARRSLAAAVALWPAVTGLLTSLLAAVSALLPSSMRLRTYILGSAALAAATVWHAVHTRFVAGRARRSEVASLRRLSCRTASRRPPTPHREQFYPSVIFLATSKPALLVLGNAAVAAGVLGLSLLQTAFLGPLRDAEVERALEKAKDALMETALAMTVFREEFSLWFAALFVTLLGAKLLHWLVTDRVEYVQTSPAVGRGTHARVAAFLLLLFVADAAALGRALASVLSKGPSVLLLFAFEYAILATGCVATAVKARPRDPTFLFLFFSPNAPPPPLLPSFSTGCTGTTRSWTGGRRRA